MSRSTEPPAATVRIFGRRLAGGFAASAVLSILLGAASVVSMITVAQRNDAAIASGSRLLADGLQLNLLVAQHNADYRAYLLNGSASYLTATTADRQQFLAEVAELRTEVTDSQTLRLLDDVSQAETRHTNLLQPVLQARARIKDLTSIAQLNAANVAPAREALQDAVAALVARLRRVSEEAGRASARTATMAITLLSVLAGLAILSTVPLAWLNRRLRREVGAAVGRIQSSSERLEAAADEQTAGGEGRIGAMDEITTTVSDLLTASRLIADHAQQVSEITDRTLTEAAAGDSTLDQARASIAAIRAQADHTVTCITTLNEKWRPIGGVTALMSELAEQTNLLAVNATIAGDRSGEEIQNLAARTAESARQIRALIDGVRDAVSTTVAASDGAAQAVDRAAQQCGRAADSLRRVAELASTAHDAGQEIELSAKQQSSAVEQVNVAAGEAARVTRKTEADALRTRKTAAHLSSLSGDLRRLVGAADVS